MITEIRHGRGIDHRDFLHLDLTGIGQERLAEKLSDISSFAKIYLGVDVATDPIPVSPTCHYMMGGIPTDTEGHVLDENNRAVEGLYAAGECACISVHGANRLGCNSLVDLVVFGRRAGRIIRRDLEQMDWVSLPSNPDTRVAKAIEELKKKNGREKAYSLRNAMQQLMTESCSVFRNEKDLKTALSTLRDLKVRYQSVTIDNHGDAFNSDLLEAIELECLLGLAETILVSAFARQESRGAHFREDYPERDDANWLKHTLIRQTDSGPEISYKPVTITRFEPKVRTY